MENIKRCLILLYVADIFPSDIWSELKISPKTRLVIPFPKQSSQRNRLGEDIQYINRILMSPDERNLAVLSYRDILFPTDLESEYLVHEDDVGYQAYTFDCTIQCDTERLQ